MTVIATKTVFDRLGEEAAELLKKYLRQEYSISLEPECLFAIEEIGIALQSLLGAEVANALLNEIRQEMMKNQKSVAE